MTDTLPMRGPVGNKGAGPQLGQGFLPRLRPAGFASAGRLFAVSSKKRTPFALMCHPKKLFVDFDEECHRLVPLGGEVFACIDLLDAHKVSEISWGLFTHSASRHNLYASAKLKEKRRICTDLSWMLPPGSIVDHINRNTLDCRRSNLRIVTASENRANERHRKNASGFRGVRISRGGRPYAVFAGKRLGNFESFGDAARAYDRAVYARFGKMGTFNFPHELPS